MNLRSLEYFLIAAEELNFTRASERLFITQQALSSHIKRLEEEYNIQLFERRPALHLTLEGEQMVFYSRHILDAEAKMRAAFSDISRNCRGSLKIGISRLRASVFFPRLWDYYHPSHPNIAIEVVDGNSTKLEDLLQAGKIHLYIGIDVPISPNQNRIELAREKVQCCMARSLIEQYRPGEWEDLICQFRRGVDLTKLLDIPFITLRKGNRLRKGLEQFFAHQLSRPNYLLECEQQELIYELAKSGAGIGLVSPTVFYQNIQELEGMQHTFGFFPILNDIPENTVYLVYRRDSPLPQYIMDLIQAACMVFRGYARAISGSSVQAQP